MDSKAYATAAAQQDAAIEAPPLVSVDERRMQVRAYNAWSALLGTRQWPDVEDLDISRLEFASNSILLDFTAGVDDPAIAFIGDRLCDEGGVSAETRKISAVPRGSLVSRLTDHYLQIIANSAPIGFEAEYVNGDGAEILYRGILLPFSSDDESIDFVLGVINWKEVASAEQESILQRTVETAMVTTAAPSGVEAWADGPQASVNDNDAAAQIGRNAPLYDHLADARIFADQAQDADGRSRSALYRAIGKAWDFALAAADQPDQLQEIYKDVGLKAQARSPMTPLVKLIFGAAYDKSRIAEYATTLTHAQCEGISAGSLAAYIESYDGGLKALVKDERARRRSEQLPKAQSLPQLDLLRHGQAAAILPQSAGDAEFVVLIGRATADGQIAIVARAEDDAALLKKAAKSASLFSAE